MHFLSLSNSNDQLFTIIFMNKCFDKIIILKPRNYGSMDWFRAEPHANWTKCARSRFRI